MIPYCVFALQRRSYREGEQSFGFFFCSSRPDRSLRKGGERGGGQTLEDSGGRRQRQIRLLPPIAPSPASPVKKKVPSLFSQKEGKENLHRRQKQRGTGAKKSSIPLLPPPFNTTRRDDDVTHVRRPCAPSALDLDNDNIQVQALRTHSRAKVSPTSSSYSLLFRLLPIQTFHHPREEGRRMPFSPPVKRGPKRLLRRRRKKKTATWGIRMDGPISLMLSPARAAVYAPSFQLLSPPFLACSLEPEFPFPPFPPTQSPVGRGGRRKKGGERGENRNRRGRVLVTSQMSTSEKKVEEEERKRGGISSDKFKGF